MKEQNNTIDWLLWLFEEFIRLVTGLAVSITHIIAPIPPSIALGFTFYYYIIHLGYPEEAARFSGICAAFSLEFLGFLSFDTLAKFYKYGGYPLYASIIGVILYFSIATVSAFLEGGNPQLMLLTFAITGAVYFVRSASVVAKDTLKEEREKERREKDKEDFNEELNRSDKKDARLFRQEQRRKKEEQKLRIEMMEKEAEIAKEMAKIEAQKQVAMSRNQPQLVTVQSAPPITTPEIKLRDYRRWQDIRNNSEAVKWISESTVEEIMAECPNVKSGRKTIKAWKNHAEKMLNE